MEPLVWLQQWYSSHCDGDWEHGYGVHIDTLDNPGWALTINLKGTELETKDLEHTKTERTENDWIHARTEISKDWQGKVFKAWGGPTNLGEMISLFRDWTAQ